MTTSGYCCKTLLSSAPVKFVRTRKQHTTLSMSNRPGWTDPGKFVRIPQVTFTPNHLRSVFRFGLDTQTHAHQQSAHKPCAHLLCTFGSSLPGQVTSAGACCLIRGRCHRSNSLHHSNPSCLATSIQCLVTNNSGNHCVVVQTCCGFDFRQISGRGGVGGSGSHPGRPPLVQTGEVFQTCRFLDGKVHLETKETERVSVWEEQSPRVGSHWTCHGGASVCAQVILVCFRARLLCGSFSDEKHQCDWALRTFRYTKQVFSQWIGLWSALFLPPLDPSLP